MKKANRSLGFLLVLISGVTGFSQNPGVTWRRTARSLLKDIRCGYQEGGTRKSRSAVAASLKTFKQNRVLGTALSSTKTRISKPDSVTDTDTTDTTDAVIDIASNEESEKISIAGIEVPKSTAQPLSLLLLSQFILFIGVGAVIPTIPLYGKAIGLSSAMNGLVISAPALALLVLAKPAGEYADRARKPAMMWGMALIALSDLGTALAQSVIPLVIARIGLGAGRYVCL